MRFNDIVSGQTASQGSLLLLRERSQLIKLGHTLNRRQCVYVQIPQPFHDLALPAGNNGELKALIRFRRTALPPALRHADSLSLLQLGQNLFCARNHLVGNTGQLRHLDAETVIRSAAHNTAQESNVIAALLDGNIKVFDSVDKILKHRQLVIMGGEKRLCAQLLPIRCIFQNGPRNAHSVKGRGTAPDFVQDQKTVGRSAADDLGHFAHLDHKG